MTILELERELGMLRQQAQLLRRHIANLPVRWAGRGGGAGAVVAYKFLRVTVAAIAARGAYTCREMSYVASGSPPVLTGTQTGTSDVTVTNIVERTFGRTFLVVGDEILAFEVAGITGMLCSQLPKGFQ